MKNKKQHHQEVIKNTKTGKNKQKGIKYIKKSEKVIEVCDIR